MHTATIPQVIARMCNEPRFTGLGGPGTLPGMVREAEGCEILHSVFVARGYQIRRDVAFHELGVAFNADGWDPAARVGFEYLTSEADDRKDLTADEMAELAARMERGELFLLIVDEREVDAPETLRFAAEKFLDEVERRRGGRP